MNQGNSPRLETATLLGKARCGDALAASELLPLVYEELRRIAQHIMSGERSDHTLQPTALVHEACLRLLGDDDVDWKDRTHFVGYAVRAMRTILVDHARRTRAAKRGGRQLRITLQGLPAADGGNELPLLDLEDLLGRLESLDERKARVVELRFFGGLTHPEIAEALGVSIKTVESDWYMARAWLRANLNRSTFHGP